MKLRQLQYVVTIADSGLNITAAADRLHTCQPGISKQLKLLEEELGVEIFVRNGRNLVRITPAGREIIAHARAILRQAEDIRRVTRHFNAGSPHAPDEPAVTLPMRRSC